MGQFLLNAAVCVESLFHCRINVSVLGEVNPDAVFRQRYLLEFFIWFTQPE